MAMNVEQLEAEVMKLSLEARARLAEKLILSLDAPTEEENLRLWVAEKEVPAEEVLRRARSAIS